MPEPSPHPDRAGDGQRLVVLSASEAKQLQELGGAFAIAATNPEASDETRAERLQHSLLLASFPDRYEDGITEDEALQIAGYIEAHGEELGGVDSEEERLIAKIDTALPTQKDSGQATPASTGKETNDHRD